MGEVSLSAKCLSCKHKDLNMIPKLKNKKKLDVVESACFAGTGKTGIGGSLELAG